jgi:hypothetical protein
MAEGFEPTRPAAGGARVRSVLTGGAGMVMFYSTAAEAMPTVSGGGTNSSPGSVSAGTLIVPEAAADASQATFVFGCGKDSVSVGGVAGTISVADAADFGSPVGLHIDVDVLRLGGPDSTAATPATDLAAAMHLPGGTRIDMLGVANVPQTAFARTPL